MNRIDFTNNGGFPLEQETLDFLQVNSAKQFEGLAKLCGDKTILNGIESDGTTVSAGMFSYNGELVLFQGCPFDVEVIIQEIPTSVVFEDGVLRQSYFTKVATCAGAGLGSFPFSDLVKLKSLLYIATLLAQMKGIVTYVGIGVAVGDVVNDKFITVPIPDQGTVDYVVGGSLVGYSANPDTDNDVSCSMHGKAADHFTLSIKDINAPINVQNLKFDFTITKAI